LQERVAASLALEEALGLRDADLARDALTAAEAAGVDGGELSAARAALEALLEAQAAERLEAARETLVAAVANESSGTHALTSAISAAVREGVPAAEVRAAEAALEALHCLLAEQEAERRAAAGALEALLASAHVEHEPLRYAVERADAACVDGETLGRALGRLDELELEEAERLELEEMVRVAAEEEALMAEEEAARAAAEERARVEAAEEARRRAEEEARLEAEEEAERAAIEQEERERMAAEADAEERRLRRAAEAAAAATREWQQDAFASSSAAELSGQLAARDAPAGATRRAALGAVEDGPFYDGPSHEGSASEKGEEEVRPPSQPPSDLSDESGDEAAGAAPPGGGAEGVWPPGGAWGVRPAPPPPSRDFLARRRPGEGEAPAEARVAESEGQRDLDGRGPEEEEEELSATGDILATLRRDAQRRFKIVVREDEGGFFLDQARTNALPCRPTCALPSQAPCPIAQIAPSDANDDRGALRAHDYLLSIDEQPLSGLSLADVRALIKNAGDATLLEAWRPTADESDDEDEGGSDVGEGEGGSGSSDGDGGAGNGGAAPPLAASPEEARLASPFEAAFDSADFAAGDAGGAIEAGAPTAEADGGHAAAHAAFHRLQEMCAEGQRAQAVLLASCAAYRSELASADEQVAQLTAELAGAHAQLERLAETVRHLSRGGEQRQPTAYEEAAASDDDSTGAVAATPLVTAR
jgi:hypothetical protein